VRFFESFYFFEELKNSLAEKENETLRKKLTPLFQNK